MKHLLPISLPKWPSLEDDEDETMANIIASLTAGLAIIESLAVKKETLNQPEG